MKRVLVVALLLAMVSPASAENRDAWQATFAGSVTVAIGGIIAWRHGATKVSEAEDQLCAGGAYEECRPTTKPLTPDEVARLNAKGNRGETIAVIGAGTAFVGVAVGAVALYKGFIAKKRDERAVVIAPTLSRDGAGAALSVRW